MWPRHTGDFAFYRAYVGPDGTPAAFSPDNVPYQPRHWLKIADRPLREGNFVMVAGYPGRTSRYALAGEFEDTVEWSYPSIVRHYRAMTALVGARGKADPDIEVRYASTVRGWENTMKNYQGQLEGFARIDALARKRAEEEAVLAWPGGRGGRGRARAHRRHWPWTMPNAPLMSATWCCGCSTARARCRRRRSTAWRSSAKLDAEREQGYQERDCRSRAACGRCAAMRSNGPRTAALLAGRIPEAARQRLPALDRGWAATTPPRSRPP